MAPLLPKTILAQVIYAAATATASAAAAAAAAATRGLSHRSPLSVGDDIYIEREKEREIEIERERESRLPGGLVGFFVEISTM